LIFCFINNFDQELLIKIIDETENQS